LIFKVFEVDDLQLSASTIIDYLLPMPAGVSTLGKLLDKYITSIKIICQIYTVLIPE
jgi:hypothetical protein